MMLIIKKVYADGLGSSYTYLADGRTASRTWARGITTVYGYTDTVEGRMQTTQYSDTTPAVISRYDLAGRLMSVDDASGSRTFANDALSRLAVETNALAVITRVHDALGRGTGYDLAISGYAANTFAVRYGYDAYGRLDSVTSNHGGVTNTFRYSYLEGSGLLSGLTNNSGIGWSRAYEPHRNLITVVTNHADSAPVSLFLYNNDAAGLRTRRVDSGSVTNLFGYNARAEVTGAEMGTSGNFYAYDDIGNRISSTVSAPLRETLYTANSLNQYTAIAGIVTNNPVYDADGNMLTNGVWSYTWDAENRLIGVASNGTPVVTNAYDYMHRRVTKTTAAKVMHFIWDGWNIAAQIDIDRQRGATNVTCYVWGLDLSGTMQGAGGVGGLLAVIRPDGTFYLCYDANGNATDYVDTTANVVAHDEFDVFGNIIAKSGTMADAFAFRFSTKYFDAETGLVMYQLRPYSPPLGRWLTRDPIEEQGGKNLYCAMLNNPIMLIDPYGLDPVGEWIKKIYFRKWWWQLRIWDDERTYHRDDGAGNTMAKRTSPQMDHYYFKKAKAEDLTATWKTFSLSSERQNGIMWYIVYSGGINFKDAGFWLYQCNQVETTGGKYEARCKDNKIEIRNTKGRFRWNDRIDSNAQRERSWAYLLELLNEIPEYLTGADFDVKIDWSDDRNEVREKEAR